MEIHPQKEAFAKKLKNNLAAKEFRSTCSTLKIGNKRLENIVADIYKLFGLSFFVTKQNSNYPNSLISVKGNSQLNSNSS
jgi:hypothetical protein